MAAKDKHIYDDSKIKTLSSLEHIRARTGMYIRLRKEILGLQKKLGFTLVCVTHDREEAFDIASKIVLMRNGLNENKGTVEDAKEHLRG